MGRASERKFLFLCFAFTQEKGFVVKVLDRIGVLLLTTLLVGTAPAFTESASATVSGPQPAETHRVRPLVKPSVHPIKYKPGANSGVPALIQNLRVATYANLTRLVLDLDRHVRFTESRHANPDRIIIKLKNATLGKTARTQASSGTIPHPFTVIQSPHRAVTVALKPTSISTYKVLPLSHPPRLVVDVYPRSPEPVRRISETAPPAATPSLSEIPARPSPPPQKVFRTIVIDPGHGGKDPGAKGHHGTEEKDVTLQIGLRLRDLLAKLGSTRVLMTRERDVFVELEDRAKFANSNEADLFVSIHVNSHPQRNVKGLEIYHFGEAKDQRALEVAARENGTPLNSTGVGWEYLVADLLTTKKIAESLELAWATKEAMVGHLNGRYNTVDHGVKTAPFYVLRYTSMPSILAEIAFVSNPAEEELLRTRSFQLQVAEALFEGVKAFFSANRQTGR